MQQDDEYATRLRQWFIAPFQLATNLRVVSLYFHTVHNPHGFLDSKARRTYFITEFPFWLEGCKALFKLTGDIPVYRKHIDAAKRSERLGSLVRRITEKVGVEGRLARSWGFKGHVEMERWVWEAPEGRFMDWAQDIGKIWPRRARQVVYLEALRINHTRD
jgi:hypothetical protein